MLNTINHKVINYGMVPNVEPESLKHIELCGRVAYKSEDRITNTSAEKFVLHLKKLKHLSVLEHSNIVFKITSTMIDDIDKIERSFLEIIRYRMGYHRMYRVSPGEIIFSGNVRSWIESLEDFRSNSTFMFNTFCKILNLGYPLLFPEKIERNDEYYIKEVEFLGTKDQFLYYKRYGYDLPIFTFKFITDRGISHEIVRHRVLSITQESTRYVNYDKKGVCFVLPTHQLLGTDRMLWEQNTTTIDGLYKKSLAIGNKPEIAREWLTNNLKTEVMATGRISCWKHFIELRSAQGAHPYVRKLSNDVNVYFKNIGVI